MGFFDQMKQLQEMKQKADEVKKKLDGIELTEENEAVKVVVNGNRKIVQLTIKDKQNNALEILLTNAINEAMAKADNVMQAEMMAVTKGIIPGM
jgi:DNA-binding protein YbaB